VEKIISEPSIYYDARLSKYIKNTSTLVNQNRFEAKIFSGNHNIFDEN